jgi:hypothetical protein
MRELLDYAMGIQEWLDAEQRIKAYSEAVNEDIMETMGDVDEILAQFGEDG